VLLVEVEVVGWAGGGGGGATEVDAAGFEEEEEATGSLDEALTRSLEG